MGLDPSDTIWSESVDGEPRLGIATGPGCSCGWIPLLTLVRA